MALRAERALPADVRGPVERSHGLRQCSNSDCRARRSALQAELVPSLGRFFADLLGLQRTIKWRCCQTNAHFSPIGARVSLMGRIS